jgi:glycosyltransferase involved in cell wall biosynthesis
MVIVSGMERMSFEVLRVLGENGAGIHCIVNSWEHHRIVRLVDSIGASWSTGYYWYRFNRHTRNPWRVLQMLWDILMTSAGLLRDAYRFRATHVFVPEHVSVIRNAPALLVLRALGRPVIVRLANHPALGRFYSFLWRFVMPPLATVYVQISDFSRERALEAGLPERKMRVIKNRVPRRPAGAGESEARVLGLIRRRKTLVVVGQVAPFKGTHLAVEATIALQREGWDVQLVILGRKPEWPPEYVRYHDSMVETVRAGGAMDRIHFVGEIESVLEILRESYLFLAPILQDETFGTALLEAKSVGLPIVGFPRGGIPEQVEDGVTGHLCEESTVASLAEGVRRYLENPESRERAKRAALASMSSPGCEFSPAVFDRKWLDVFGLGAPVEVAGRATTI